VELDDRTRPAVRDQQRKRVVVRRALVDEVNVETVDLGDEVVEPVQRGFACAPVVFICPIVGQLAGVAQRDALIPVIDGFGLRPSRAGQPVLQVGEVCVGNRDAKRIDLGHSPILSRSISGN
jgi:hypothetical protein